MQLKEQLLAIAADSFQLRGISSGPEKRTPAAVLVLFCGEHFLGSKILVTLRAKNLGSHSGQVAFPGGMMDSIDEGSFTKTALRECFEETGIPHDSVEALGELPSYPTVTAGFEVTPVLGRLLVDEPILSLSAAEVVHAEWVSVSTLRETRYLEKRIVQGVERELPVFLWGGEKMWGLSALIFDLILKRYDRLEG